MSYDQITDNCPGNIGTRNKDVIQYVAKFDKLVNRLIQALANENATSHALAESILPENAKSAVTNCKDNKDCNKRHAKHGIPGEKNHYCDKSRDTNKCKDNSS